MKLPEIVKTLWGLICSILNQLISNGKKLLASEKLLPVFALLLMTIALISVWQISQVSFLPPADSINLTKNMKAQVRMDTGNLCPPSIASTMILDDIVNDTLQTKLWSCVENLHKAEGNVAGAVVLPDEWRDNSVLRDAGYPQRVLYSIDYPVHYWPDAGLGLWSLVITGVGHNAAVFLNGRLLGWSGSFEPPYARNHARPLSFPVSDGLLEEGENRFDIYVVSESPQAGFLGKAYIAPAEMLTAEFRLYHFFRYTAPQIICISTAVLSALMCALWFYRRRDVEYGLFGLIGLFWSVHTMDQFFVNIPLSTHSWSWLVQASFGLMVLFSILFIHRFLGLSRHKSEWMLMAVSAVLIGLFWLVPDAWLFTVSAYFWNPLVLLGALYVLVCTLVAIREKPGLELYALTTAIAVIFLLACRDQMVMLGLLPIYEGRFLHFGAPFLLLAFTWILLRRFVHSLQASEQLNLELLQFNEELETRVEEKSQRIAKSYEMIRELGQERVVQEERSRIMRDMHDGIGVYLTSMLRQLEFDPPDREHLRDSAHNALNDLRLMIDSLGNASTDLPAMLGMFRTRITTLLDACQVELVWEVGDLPPVEDFGPERALNLLRILQEAITNALKHSAADQIVLSAVTETMGEKNSQIIIRVQDNGKGFVPQHLPGNGLKNMEHR
ncbi:MAG: 7TM diverse intracellular signaling domain-containing protein, partial [Thiolinea sp.]